MTATTSPAQLESILGAVIAANSVVRKDESLQTIVAGVPAHVIKM